MVEQKSPLKFMPVPAELFKEVDDLARAWRYKNHSDVIRRLLKERPHHDH